MIQPSHMGDGLRTDTKTIAVNATIIAKSRIRCTNNDGFLDRTIIFVAMLRTTVTENISSER